MSDDRRTDRILNDVQRSVDDLTDRKRGAFDDFSGGGGGPLPTWMRVAGIVITLGASFCWWWWRWR